MNNTSNRNGVLSCGKGWKMDGSVFSRWIARGSGETGAAGLWKSGTVISFGSSSVERAHNESNVGH